MTRRGTGHGPGRLCGVVFMFCLVFSPLTAKLFLPQERELLRDMLYGRPHQAYLTANYLYWNTDREIDRLYYFLLINRARDYGLSDDAFYRFCRRVRDYGRFDRIQRLSRWKLLDRSAARGRLEQHRQLIKELHLINRWSIEAKELDKPLVYTRPSAYYSPRRTGLSTPAVYTTQVDATEAAEYTVILSFRGTIKVTLGGETCVDIKRRQKFGNDKTRFKILLPSGKHKLRVYAAPETLFAVSLIQRKSSRSVDRPVITDVPKNVFEEACRDHLFQHKNAERMRFILFWAYRFFNNYDTALERAGYELDVLLPKLSSGNRSLLEFFKYEGDPYVYHTSLRRLMKNGHLAAALVLADAALSKRDTGRAAEILARLSADHPVLRRRRLTLAYLHGDIDRLERSSDRSPLRYTYLAYMRRRQGRDEAAVTAACQALEYQQQDASLLRRLVLWSDNPVIYRILRRNIRMVPYKSEYARLLSRYLYRYRGIRPALTLNRQYLNRFPRDKALIRQTADMLYELHGTGDAAKRFWTSHREILATIPGYEKKLARFFHTRAFYAPYRRSVPPPRKVSGGTRLLFYNTVVRLSKDLREQVYTRAVYAVGDNTLPPRLIVQFNPKRQHVNLLHVHRVRNGEKTNVDVELHSEERPRESYYTSRKSWRVTSPSWQSGDIFDVAYTRHNTKPLLDSFYSRRFFFGSQHIPVLRRQLIYLYPSSRKLYWRTTAALHPKRNTRAQEIEMRLNYSQKEPYHIRTLPPAEFAEQAVVSTEPTWSALGKRLYRLYQPAMQSTTALKTLAQSLIKNLDTPTERFEAVFAYVRDHIRYVALEYGRGAVLPRSAATVMKTSYGDCKDKASLLTALLRECGIRADVVLVGNINEGVVRSRRPFMGAFQHAVVRVHGEDRSWFCDPTVKGNPYYHLPWAYRGVHALPLTARSQPVRTEKASPYQNRHVHIAEVSPLGAGYNVSGSLMITGDFIRIRGNRYSRDEARALLKRQLPYTTKKGASLTVKDLTVKPTVPSLRIYYRAFLPKTVFSHEGLFLSLIPLVRYLPKLPSYAKKMPVRLAYPCLLRRILRVKLPPGQLKAVKPFRFYKETDDILANIAIKRKSEEIIIRRTCQLKNRFIPADRLSAFRSILSELQVSEGKHIPYQTKQESP